MFSLLEREPQWVPAKWVQDSVHTRHQSWVLLLPAVEVKDFHLHQDTHQSWVLLLSVAEVLSTSTFTKTDQSPAGPCYRVWLFHLQTCVSVPHGPMPRDSVSRGPMPRGTLPRDSVSRGLYHVVRCYVILCHEVCTTWYDATWFCVTRSMPRGTMPRESVSRGLYHVVRCHVVSFLRGPVLNSHVILSLMCSLSNVL